MLCYPYLFDTLNFTYRQEILIDFGSRIYSQEASIEVGWVRTTKCCTEIDELLEEHMKLRRC